MTGHRDSNGAYNSPDDINPHMLDEIMQNPVRERNIENAVIVRNRQPTRRQQPVENTALDLHKRPRNRYQDNVEDQTICGNGILFQFKLLMLTLWRAAKSFHYEKFRLTDQLRVSDTTENICFQYKIRNSDAYKLRFIQVNKQELVTCPQFIKLEIVDKQHYNSLPFQRYFHSYLQIKQAIKYYSALAETELDNFTVVSQFALHPNIRQCLSVSGKDHLFGSSLYKLKQTDKELFPNPISNLMYSSDYHDLVEEFTQHILKDTTIYEHGIYSLYSYPLLQEIFDVYNSTDTNFYLKFKTYFFSDEAKVFSDKLIKEIIFRESYTRFLGAVTKLIKYISEVSSSKGNQPYSTMAEKEIIDIQNNKFHNIFIKQILKSNGKIRYLSTEAQKLRAIIFDTMISDIEIEAAKNLLKFKIRKFKPTQNLHIVNEKKFARQIGNMIKKNSASKLILITEQSIAELRMFRTNLRNIAKHLFIKNNGISISNNFLCTPDLPYNFEKFREELRTFLGFTIFESLTEYTFDIRIEELTETLSYERLLTFNRGDITEFLFKLRFAFNYPNDRDATYDRLEKKIISFEDSTMNSKCLEILIEEWMSERINRYTTFQEVPSLLAELKRNLSSSTATKLNLARLERYKLNKPLTKVLLEFLKTNKPIHNVMESKVYKFDPSFLENNDVHVVCEYTKKFALLDLQQLKYYHQELNDDVKLLIVRCNSGYTTEGFYHWYAILMDFLKGVEKKIILLHTEKHFIPSIIKVGDGNIFKSLVPGLKNELETMKRKEFNDTAIMNSKLDQESYQYFYLNTLVVLKKELSDATPDRLCIMNQSKASFSSLCCRHPNDTIHLLTEKKQQLIWNCSQGSVRSLIPFRQINKINRFDRTGIEENDFIKRFDEFKVVLVYGLAGSGKTTFLSRLCSRTSIVRPDLWLVRVNLADLREAFAREILLRSFGGGNYNNKDYKAAVRFLLENMVYNTYTTDLEKSVLLYSFYQSVKMAFFVDGFDEVSPLYGDVVLDFLQALKESDVNKLIITTRLDGRERLELGMDTFAYKLEDFCPGDQMAFCRCYWRKLFKIRSDIHYIRIRQFTEALIIQNQSIIYKSAIKGIGSALITRMLAEIFTEDCLEFTLNKMSTPSIPKYSDVIDIFTKFSNKIQQNHMTDSDGSSTFNEERYKEELRLLMKHDILEKQGEEMMSIIIDTSDMIERMDSLIMFKNLSNYISKRFGDRRKPYFEHRTIAEYFLAQSVYKIIVNEDSERFREYIIKDIFMKPNYSVVNSLVSDYFERRRIPDDIMRPYGVTLSRIWKMDKSSVMDANGDSIFHMHVKNIGLFKFLLDCYVFYPGKLLELLLWKNNEGKNVMNLAISQGHCEVLDFLMELKVNWD